MRYVQIYNTSRSKSVTTSVSFLTRKGTEVYVAVAFSRECHKICLLVSRDINNTPYHPLAWQLKRNHRHFQVFNIILASTFM